MRFASTASRQENGREFLRQPEAPASYRAGADVLLRRAPDPHIRCGFPLGPGFVREGGNAQPPAAPPPLYGIYHNTCYGTDGDRRLSAGGAYDQVQRQRRDRDPGGGSAAGAAGAVERGAGGGMSFRVSSRMRLRSSAKASATAARCYAAVGGGEGVGVATAGREGGRGWPYQSSFRVAIIVAAIARKASVEPARSA